METAQVTLHTYFNISDTKFIILENGNLPACVQYLKQMQS